MQRSANEFQLRKPLLQREKILKKLNYSHLTAFERVLLFIRSRTRMSPGSHASA